MADRQVKLIAHRTPLKLREFFDSAGGLELTCHIGWPDEEREVVQTLKADVVMDAPVPFRQTREDLANTIDYDAVQPWPRRNPSSS